MSKTQNYRKQHDQLLEIATDISKQLSEDNLSSDANGVRILLSNFMGKLKYHLAIEDKSLYPNLLAHPDEKIVSTAQEFIDEMGSMGKVVEAYNSKWSSAAKIQSDAADFIRETKNVFGVLAKRIEKENNELYKMVDNST